VAVTWFTVLGNHPSDLGLFAFHPTLQTLSITLFIYGIAEPFFPAVFFSYIIPGIVTLQPTSGLNPKAKTAGLNRHQLIILGLAFPCISVGTLMIIWNKNIHEKPHFVTWHGTFGIMAIAWMVRQPVVIASPVILISFHCQFLQMILGAGSVWFNGKLFGGGSKAKALWKYHRFATACQLAFLLLIYFGADSLDTYFSLFSWLQLRLVEDGPHGRHIAYLKLPEFSPMGLLRSYVIIKSVISTKLTSDRLLLLDFGVAQDCQRCSSSELYTV